MHQKSFKDRILSFDIYQKLPKGYLQPSLIGAICKYIMSVYLLLFSYCFNYNFIPLFECL